MKIVLGYDGSEAAKKALEQASSQAPSMARFTWWLRW